MNVLSLSGPQHQNFEESQEAMKQQLLQLSLLMKALDPELLDYLGKQWLSLSYCVSLTLHHNPNVLLLSEVDIHHAVNSPISQLIIFHLNSRCVMSLPGCVIHWHSKFFTLLCYYVVCLFQTPRTVALCASVSVGYWSGLRESSPSRTSCPFGRWVGGYYSTHNTH